MAERLAIFVDRDEAGRRLAAALERFRATDPVVVALPRGGVPVAYEVARLLQAPLDVLVVRKIGAPYNPEYGIGAIAEGGFRFFRHDDHELIGVSGAELDALVLSESAELERRRARYRGDREPVSVAGRTVLLVDDGVATGGTAIVAAAALCARGAEAVVLAVPVGPPGCERRLARSFDDVVCLAQPDGFAGVGQFYVDFSPTSDDEVVRLLKLGHRAPAPAGADPPREGDTGAREARIEPEPNVELEGDLQVPADARGLVLFAHGGGSSRKSPRNQRVAAKLNRDGFATLLFDLLTPVESGERANVFDIDKLAARLIAVTRWTQEDEGLKALPIFYFGASTGAAAALRAAAQIGAEVHAVVSRGGRPDLAGHDLEKVVSPTLLIVGGADWQVLALNEEAAENLVRCRHQVAIVPGATHLFEEPGALDLVARRAAEWFSRFLTAHS
jgi:predicted phosphoribosyltransferase/pimeloyl-ACP methyl ester carboxylesterase